jgi:hypothetical protein
MEENEIISSSTKVANIKCEFMGHDRGDRHGCIGWG